MRLTVKARIALVMGIVVAANVAAGGVATYYYAQAAEYGSQAQAALEKAKRVGVVSQATSEFIARVGDLALSFSEGSASEDQSTTYGELQGADQVGSGGVRRLTATLAASDASAVADGWYMLRLSAYTWVNGEAAQNGAGFRLRETQPGVFRSSVDSNITTPSALVGLAGPQLRAAVRDEANGFRDRTLRRIAVSADAAAVRARAAEKQATDLARSATLAAITLSVIVTMLAAVWLYRTIATPLARAKRFADTVAAGDLSATIGKHTADEIGTLTHAVEDMKDSIGQKIAAMQEMAGAVLFIAEGVHESADSARSAAVALGDTTAGLAVMLDGVVEQSDTLSGLAAQMVTAPESAGQPPAAL